MDNTDYQVRNKWTNENSLKKCVSSRQESAFTRMSDENPP